MQEELDYSLNLDSRNRFEVNLGDKQILVDMADFADHLQNISMIDEYATEGEGMIMIQGSYEFFCQVRGRLIETSKGRYIFTFQEYLKEFGTGDDFSPIVESYLKTLKIKTNV